MLVRLEGQLTQNQSNPDFLFTEALKVYLMLGQQGKLDKSLIRRWMALDWAAQFPGPENEADLNALKAHLDACSKTPWRRSAQRPADRADAIDPPASPAGERAYSIIKTHPKITALPEWRLSEHGGPAVARVITRRRALAFRGIPGLHP